MSTNDVGLNFASRPSACLDGAAEVSVLVPLTGRADDVWCELFRHDLTLPFDEVRSVVPSTTSIAVAFVLNASEQVVRSTLTWLDEAIASTNDRRRGLGQEAQRVQEEVDRWWGQHAPPG